MRITSHNSRSGKNGVYRASHNDRNFDIAAAEHIDPARTEKNFYWSIYSGLTFEQTEQKFYETYFSAALEKRNARCISQRHPGRCKSMEEYRKSPQTCPEETLWYIGDQKNCAGAALLWRCVAEQVRWEQKVFPGVVHLDLALHVDEGGAPHIHDRRVWTYHTAAGDLAVGQEKALEEMGVPLPDPSREPGRKNCRKMTYSRACREHFAQICLAHGLEIELEPREASRSGRELEDYKASQAKARAKAAEQEEQRALEQARAAEQDKETAQEYARGVLDRIDQEEAAHSDMLSKMWQQKRRLEGEIEELKEDWLTLQYSQWMSREPDIFEAVQRVAAQRRERGLAAPELDIEEEVR